MPSKRKYLSIITFLPFFIEMLQYDWLWSGHMIIKEMFYIPIKLKPELARASMMTSDVNNQWRSKFQQQIKFTTKNSTILMNAFFCSFYTPIRFIQNVLRSTLLHTNKTTKKCIQFLNKVLILMWLTICTKSGIWYASLSELFMV